MTKVGTDLAQLNETERRVLSLLAEGHTAKSIAALTGHSVSAINERLREARRKTGAGSSRELARLLKVQENWDRKIGLASGKGSVEARYPRWNLSTGVAIMSIAALVLTITAAQLSSPSPVDAEIAADPLLAGLGGIEGLALRVRTEMRDGPWADAAEAQLQARYAALVQSGHITISGIRCAASVCEVRATLLDKDEAILNQTMDQLQLPEFNELAPPVQLKHDAAGFGSNGASVLYWKRTG